MNKNLSIKEIDVIFQKLLEFTSVFQFFSTLNELFSKLKTMQNNGVIKASNF